MYPLDYLWGHKFHPWLKFRPFFKSERLSSGIVYYIGTLDRLEGFVYWISYRIPFDPSHANRVSRLVRSYSIGSGDYMTIALFSTLSVSHYVTYFP